MRASEPRAKWLCSLRAREFEFISKPSLGQTANNTSQKEKCDASLRVRAGPPPSALALHPHEHERGQELFLRQGPPPDAGGTGTRALPPDGSSRRAPTQDPVAPLFRQRPGPGGERVSLLPPPAPPVQGPRPVDGRGRGGQPGQEDRRGPQAVGGGEEPARGHQGRQDKAQEGEGQEGGAVQDGGPVQDPLLLLPGPPVRAVPRAKVRQVLRDAPSRPRPHHAQPSPLPPRAPPAAPPGNLFGRSPPHGTVLFLLP